VKLCRYGAAGQEKPGLIDGEGRMRDLSAHVEDIDPTVLGKSTLDKLAALDPSRLPAVKGEVRFGVPLSGVRQFVAIGLNYTDHASEAGMAIPQEPVIFMKAVSCLSGPNDPLLLPRHARKMDWEVELGIVIGREAFEISEADALGCVAGYCVVNDVSEREYQLERGGTWDKGKSFPSFGPVGPWLVTADEVPDPQNLGLWLEVNGKRMQDGNTASMIFGIASLISYVSMVVQLLPGDIITTGTPAGVGMGQRPEPIYLRAGDILRLGIEKLGEQVQEVVSRQ
jgi:2-keto-4-pentenoate hydratase/2-oxohepta-3-ene-1,7-dioic acid hydratase in catechol pathway